MFQVLFVMNPNIQPAALKIHEMILSHPLAMDNLAPALMNFYTGMWVLSFHDSLSIYTSHR